MPPKKAAPAAAPVNHQVLPLKEQALFRAVLKFYEGKQYKKSLKTCDQILKKYPLHGETISMKGLTLSNLKRKDEAHELVKKGLALNIASHVCWHVYGLLYRAEHKYDDSIKCYQQAIKRDPENQNILKDLAHLQIQRRMIDGFTETRRKLLVAAATRKNNWIAYAIGNHLAGNHAKALAILEAWNKTQKEEKKSDEIRGPDYEDSELLMYKNQILEESGQIEQALAHLNECEKEVVDKIAWREKKASFLFRLGRHAESESIYRSLIATNPDNYAYYHGLQRALGYEIGADGHFTTEQQASLLPLYESLAKENKFAAAPKRLPLAFSTGKQFHTLVDNYLKTNLRKGIPSLFRDLRPLYKDPAKAATIEQLINEYLTQLRSSRRFSSNDAAESESPSCLLWTLFYASHHYDHFNNTARALELVDEAIAHTPTTIDLYVHKARIYKHAHDHRSAYALMEHARRLDTADRYLNTRCVRYAFRADECTKGDETIALFLREGDTPQQSLFEMQVMWYELASGASWFRQKQWGRALKKLTAIDKQFEDMTEDQFDFHTYCLRKATLRAYIQLLRWEDTLRSHRFFFRAAQLIVKTYLRLYDIPHEAEAEAAAEADGLSEEEKKKLDKSKKRLAAKAKKQAYADDKKLEAESKSQAKQGVKKEADEDPNGDKLAETTTPLEEATKYVEKLKFYSPDAIETHLLAIQVYLRKEKYLLVLKALKKGYAIAPDHPELHTGAISFVQRITKQADTLHPLVKQVIEAERATLSGIAAKSTAQQLNDAFLTKHNNSLAHRLAVARSELELNGAAGRTRATELLLSSAITTNNGLNICEEAHAFLSDTVKDADAATTFAKSCATRFPFTPYFGAKQPTLPEIDDQKQE